MNRKISRAAFLVCLTLLGAMHADSQQRARRAGEISALLPAGFIVRGGAPQRAAQRANAVLWQDVLRTDRTGRIRATLEDGSILNVGAESQIQVLEHDAATQRTRLQLAYGKVRASVVRISRAGGSFEIRTPVAVAGVVGTRFSVSISPEQHTFVVALEERVRVRSSDPAIPGEVVLRPGEFTHVAPGSPPMPPEMAPPEMLRESEEDLDLPSTDAPISRLEISWPPTGCGARATLLLRAWSSSMQDGKEVETQLDSEMLAGRLTLGSETLSVEGGRANLPSRPSTALPKATFTLKGRAKRVEVKIWEPVELAEGEGWRAPRAVFAGSAFAVQGPLEGGRPDFEISGQKTTMLWQGPCGAGFLAPLLPGGEYPATLLINNEAAGRGKINLISVSYRPPVPPSVLKGQTSRFGADIVGLAGLDAYTQGRPVLVTTFVNTTPTVIGNLRSSTRGAFSSGETLIFRIGRQNISGGIARLDGTGTGRAPGMFSLEVLHKLDPALGQPRFPLAPVE
jgi:hypothetical protein